MSMKQCSCGMQTCQTARLWQENSALRAMVEVQGKELSLFQGAAMFYYGIATGLRVDSPEAVLIAAEAQQEQNQSSVGELSDEYTPEQLSLFRSMSGTTCPPNCT